MSEAHSRKKQPALIRRLILDSAVDLARQEGLVGVTVEAVARAAGVTKGGLFHHFPSKQALIQGMFEDVLQKLDAEIDDILEKDDYRPGSFTRAYIETMLSGEEFGLESPWSAIGVATISDPSLGLAWSHWLAARLERHVETDGAPILEVVRLAVDGAWLAHISHGKEGLDVAAIREQLLSLTRG
ncbi:TetR/AcrR family transcriptional regulator [Neorhizobium alkalisoli]|uniref:TetR family transcriptional regulator n=1 Tax=Neorhizobium alkalisoli TaxID=528178 RepID=A0A561R240_9HYPH|nr:TetR family transcriptional regulator [Neorhizobium alkalisoli]